MPWFFAPLAHVLAVMTVALPLLSLRRYKELGDPTTTPERRRRLLVSAIVRKWLLALPALLLWAYAPQAVLWVGPRSQWWVTAMMIVAVGAGAAALAIRRRDPKRRQRLVRSAAPFAALLPRTPAERPVFVGMAVTAGITEEIVYRGFLIAYLAWALSSQDWQVPAIVAGVIFGLAHLYQGRKGVLKTGLLGVLFGLLYLRIGLLPLMVVHTLADLRALLIPVGPSGAGEGPGTTASPGPPTAAP